MGGQGVHQHVEHRLGVVLEDGEQGGVEAVAVAVADVGDDRVAEGVVHDRVELPAEEIAPADAVGDLGGGVLPHLADDGGVGVGALDAGGDPVEKLVGQFVRHVEPPARDAVRKPFAQHPVFAADELAVGGVALVQVGQLLEPPPALVAVGVVGELIPAPVGALGVVVGPAVPVAALFVEVDAVRAGVVEDAVEDDADAERLRAGAQLPEVLLGAEQRVDPEEIRGVVAVVGVRLEDGVQVDRAHPHAFEVGQLLGDAPQVAAEVVGVGHLAVTVGQVFGQLVPVAVEPPVGGHAALGPARRAEAVGEYLVEDAVLHEFGRAHRLVVDGELPHLPALRQQHAEAVLVAGDAHLSVDPGDLEEVEIELRVGGIEDAGVGAAHPVARLVVHGDALGGIPAVRLVDEQRGLAQLVGDRQEDAEGDDVVRGDRPEGGFAAVVAAVEEKGTHEINSDTD